jgi:hypothetical protein
MIPVIHFVCILQQSNQLRFIHNVYNQSLPKRLLMFENDVDERFT